MLWFKNDRTNDMICMETTVLGDIRVQTVMDSGFFLYPKKRDPIPHKHLNHELYFIRRGHCRTVCAGESFDCTAGDLLLIPSGCEHSVRALSHDASVYSLRFSVSPHPPEGGNLPLYDALIRSLHAPRKTGNDPSVTAVLSQLRAELAEKSVLCHEKIRALLTLFYADLFRTLTDTAPAPAAEDFSIILDPKAPGALPGYCKDTPQEFYIDVLDDFFTHLPPAPTLELLCRRLHLSLRQTRRLILTHYGISFREKLSRTRIDTAKRLIRTTSLSLETIAEEAGYASYKSFFEAFTAQTGLTPSAYRQSGTSAQANLN